MGKWTDKLYITNREWKEDFGGCKKRQKEHLFELPLDYCSVGMQPALNPVCDSEGRIYEESRKSDFARRMRFVRNECGEVVCAVTGKALGSHLKVYATPSGSVVSEEGLRAIEFKDPLTDAKLTTNDLIILQDPSRTQVKKAETFGLRIYKTKDITPKTSAPVHGHSTGKLAASLTSTAMAPLTRQEPARITAWEQFVRSAEGKDPALATIRTTLGDIHLELFALKAPKATYNFLKHALDGSFCELLLSRLQAGSHFSFDVGRSVWGKAFKEMCFERRQYQRGMLAMISPTEEGMLGGNFCITLGGAETTSNLRLFPFGKVIGGVEVLEAIESLQVDRRTFKPLTSFCIQDVIVVEYPFDDNKLAAIKR